MTAPKGYFAMRAGAQARTYLAGFGVTGALLAAIGAAFVVGGGIMAFQHWPARAAAPAERDLAVAAASASAAPRAAAAPVVALPPAAAPAVAARRTTAVRVAGRQATRPPAGRAGRGPTTPVVSPPTPAPAPSTAPAAVPAPAPRDLAAAVTSVTRTTAGTVRSVGTVLPGAAPLTDLAGATVDRAGQALVGLLGRRP